MDFSRLNMRMPWCERGDSNPHGCPLDPKSSASASSATLARKTTENKRPFHVCQLNMESRKRAGASQAQGSPFPMGAPKKVPAKPRGILKSLALTKSGEPEGIESNVGPNFFFRQTIALNWQVSVP